MRFRKNPMAPLAAVAAGNERGDRITAREYAPDDLAADAAEAPITAVLIVPPSGKAYNHEARMILRGSSSGCSRTP
jgi:hypothetical protein